MDVFARARRMMVDGQLRINDVTNPYLIAAIDDVPRERFVPQAKVDLAYLDCDLELRSAEADSPARYLLKPLVLAKLIEIAGVAEHDRVLDIGCASGYSTAVLARLAARVVALEEDAELARIATANLAAEKIGNALVRTGPLPGGAAADAPFDVILVNGAVEFIPETLSASLADGGRLVCVMRRGPVGSGMVFHSFGGHVSGRAIFDATAPLLPGFARAPSFVF
jgi:protein-L-isoaspartate(D-aspartate) O-methyltransferase